MTLLNGKSSNSMVPNHQSYIYIILYYIILYYNILYYIILYYIILYYIILYYIILYISYYMYVYIYIYTCVCIYIYIFRGIRIYFTVPRVHQAFDSLALRPGMQMLFRCPDCLKCAESWRRHPRWVRIFSPPNNGWLMDITYGL